MKAKAPAMLFFVRDWLTDTELSACSPLVRGVWMDILANMWLAPKRGVLTGTKEQLARICRCSIAEIDEFLNAQKVSRFANVTLRNGKITIVNRRMRREEMSRKSNVDRQKRHREKKPKDRNGDSNAEVTSPLAVASSSAVKDVKKHLSRPPKKVGEKKQRERDLIWDKICEVFNLDPVTRKEEIRIGGIVRDLKLKKATPEEIQWRGDNYKLKWPDMAFTPDALLKHWDSLRLSPAQAKAEASAAGRERAAKKQQAIDVAAQAEQEEKKQQGQRLRDHFAAMSPEEKDTLKAQARERLEKRRAPPGGWSAKIVMMEVLSLLAQKE